MQAIWCTSNYYRLVYTHTTLEEVYLSKSSGAPATIIGCYIHIYHSEEMYMCKMYMCKPSGAPATVICGDIHIHHYEEMYLS